MARSSRSEHDGEGAAARAAELREGVVLGIEQLPAASPALPVDRGSGKVLEPPGLGRTEAGAPPASLAPELAEVASPPTPGAGEVPSGGADASLGEPSTSRNWMAVATGVPVEVEEVAGEAALAGAPLSLEQLYAASYQSLVRLAFVLTGSREVSEDLVQDCFVRLHRHLGRLESPNGYLRQAVVNACRSHFRRLGRERDRRPMLYVLDATATGSAGQLHGELHDVLLSLPHRQRAAIVLRFYEDLSEAEIADALGCRPGTVGSLIHRGLERMRRVIEA